MNIKVCFFALAVLWGVASLRRDNGRTGAAVLMKTFLNWVSEVNWWLELGVWNMVIASLLFQLGRRFGLHSVVADLPTPSVRQRKRSVRSLWTGGSCAFCGDWPHPSWRHPRGQAGEIRRSRQRRNTRASTHEAADGVLEFPDPWPRRH